MACRVSPYGGADAEPATWAGILLHLPGAGVEARQAAAVDVNVPHEIGKRVEDQTKYPALNGPVRLAAGQLAGWLASGLMAIPRDTEAGGPANGDAR